VQTDSGEVIQANPIAVSNVGEKTTVSLRPERVIINPDNDVENQFECNVQEIIYHGDHTRLRVSLLNNSDFILKIPNSEKNSNISTDDKIKLGWSSVDCRALD
jgi:putative spermidine/putrescine transport system ATP-binding protein